MSLILFFVNIYPGLLYFDQLPDAAAAHWPPPAKSIIVPFFVVLLLKDLKKQIFEKIRLLIAEIAAYVNNMIAYDQIRFTNFQAQIYRAISDLFTLRKSKNTRKEDDHYRGLLFYAFQDVILP